MVTMALRYIPTVVEEARVVFQSQRLRGMRIWHRNPIRTSMALLNLLKPILIRNARRAGTIADAILSRGFSPQLSVQDWKRSALYPIRLRMHDYLVIWSVSILTFGCLAAKLVYLVYAKGIYYQPWLRPVYDIARRWI
jgi:energy-coupling factor transport system permease protein